jgi:hypothetical protein
VIDVVRLWIGSPRSNAADDLLAMSKGEALLVSAVLERQAGWKFGTLRIAMFEDPAFVWFSRRGEEAILPPPLQIDDIREARGDERRHMKVPRFRVRW